MRAAVRKMQNADSKNSRTVFSDTAMSDDTVMNSVLCITPTNKIFRFFLHELSLAACTTKLQRSSVIPPSRWNPVIIVAGNTTNSKIKLLKSNL